MKKDKNAPDFLSGEEAMERMRKEGEALVDATRSDPQSQAVDRWRARFWRRVTDAGRGRMKSIYMLALVVLLPALVAAGINYRTSFPIDGASSATTAMSDTGPNAPTKWLWASSNNGYSYYHHSNGNDYVMSGPALGVPGAKIDGSTDDSAAINAALAAVSGPGGTVVIPNGNVNLGATTISIAKPGTTLILGAGTYTSTANPVISITANNVTVRGQGYFATAVYANSATNDVIVANGGAGISGVKIENMSTDSHSGTNTRTAGYGIHLIAVGNWTVRDVYLHDPWIGLSVDNSNTGTAENITMDTTLAAQSIYDGVQHTNASVQNSFIRVSVTSASTAIHSGFYINKQSDSFQCVNCLVQASGTSGVATNYGFLFQSDGGAYNPRWSKITDSYVEVDKTLGIGYQIDQARDTEITNSYGVWGKNIYHMTVNSQSTRIHGGSALLSAQYGVLIDGGTDIDINGLLVDSSGQQANTTYDGIAIAGGTNIKIENCTSGNSLLAGASPASGTNFQRYGIFTTNAADYYWLINNNLGNTLGTGGLSDTATGTHKVVFGNYGNGGSNANILISGNNMSLASSGNMNIGTDANTTGISLGASNGVRWNVASSAIYPNGDNAYSVGLNGNRPSTVYGLNFKSGDTAATDTAGNQMNITGQSAGAASAQAGKAGGLVVCQPGSGGNGTAGLAAGNGGSWYIRGGPAGTNGGGGAGTNGNVVIGDQTTGEIDVGTSGLGLRIMATAFASLPSAANGTLIYCNDCTVANPCASGGTGALAKRLNGQWVCN